MFRSKATTFFIHAAGWLMFLAFPLLFMNRTQENISSTYFVILSPYYWLFCITYLVMFYLNAWYLIPKLVFKKKYLQYGIILFLLFSCVYYLQPFDNLLGHNLRHDKKPKTAIAQMPGAGLNNSDSGAADSSGPAGKAMPFGPLPHQDLRMQDPSLKPSTGIIFIHQSGNIDMVGLFIFLMIMGLSMAVTTVQKWQSTEQQVIKTEAEKSNAELSFLKAQINPHFLFNTLNNIYTLSVTNSKHTSESIMKLSNIMRYVTDEVTEDFVLLKSEIDCINDYIDLQRLRLGKKTTLNVNTSDNIINQKIAPLILMTFIENLFKYGISNHAANAITIEITVDERHIRFFCQNAIFEHKPSVKRTGIGINNTRQRLELVYPGRHQLDINTDNNLFTVTLTIDI